MNVQIRGKYLSGMLELTPLVSSFFFFAVTFDCYFLALIISFPKAAVPRSFDCQHELSDVKEMELLVSLD